MRILKSTQLELIRDPVRSKFAMVVPVLEATVYSLQRERTARLGGIARVTVADLAREFREGSGDAGICFEYAVHEAIATNDPLIRDLASNVLDEFCGIHGGSHSILFGPEKDGTIPIVESVEDSLTDESRIYVGNRGQPPKLRRYIRQIVRAYRRNEERARLPRSISGLWKADLFIGNRESERWVGTTVKIQASDLEAAQGLRIGIYPRVNAADGPRRDDDLNLVRLPLPYDGAFMELFYKAFFLVRAFLLADARVPVPVRLPDAEDRFIAEELQGRRQFPVLDVIDALRDMSQQGLLRSFPVEYVPITAALSVEGGLSEQPPADDVQSDFVSVTPEAREA